MLAAPFTTRSGLLDTPKRTYPPTNTKKHYPSTRIKNTFFMIRGKNNITPQENSKIHQSYPLRTNNQASKQANKLFLQDSLYEEENKFFFLHYKIRIILLTICQSKLRKLVYWKLNRTIKYIICILNTAQIHSLLIQAHDLMHRV